MNVTALSCSRCARTHDPALAHNVCECGAPLLVEYDLERVGRTVSPGLIAARPATMWRYRELLPLDDPANAVTLGEGMTPMIAIPALAGTGIDRLWVKDEGCNPTGTFKARGASCGISRARELGVREVALPTAGNAGGAWAAYGAAAGMTVHVAMPSDAPEANAIECRAFGARLTMVEGLISDAGAWIARGVRENGWFDAATLREPYRIEGKATLGYEIAEQLGWTAPDVIVYPCGGGVGLIGIERAFRRMIELGWVRAPLPRLVAVQASGCAPIVRAFEDGDEESRFWQGAETLAAGLRVPKALGDFLVLRALRESGGTAIAVDDADILAAMATLAREAGLLASPEGAATLVAARALRERGEIAGGEQVVLLNTGSGLKYPDALRAALG